MVDEEEDYFISSPLKSLLKGFLHPDPAKRLGHNGKYEIQAHPYFEGVDWSLVRAQKYPLYPPNQKNKLNIKSLMANSSINMKQVIERDFAEQILKWKQKPKEESLKRNIDLLKVEELYQRNKEVSDQIKYLLG